MVFAKVRRVAVWRGSVGATKESRCWCYKRSRSVRRIALSHSFIDITVLAKFPDLYPSWSNRKEWAAIFIRIHSKRFIPHEKPSGSMTLICPRHIGLFPLTSLITTTTTIPLLPTTTTSPKWIRLPCSYWHDISHNARWCAHSPTRLSPHYSYGLLRNSKQSSLLGPLRTKGVIEDIERTSRELSFVTGGHMGYHR